MFSAEFIISYLTFYLEAKIQIEGNFFKISNPNTVLKLIPVEQDTSVDSSFRLNFKTLL